MLISLFKNSIKWKITRNNKAIGKIKNNSQLISKLNIKFKSQLEKNNFELKDFLKLGRLGGEFKYFGNHITTLWKEKFKFDDNKTIISF